MTISWVGGFTGNGYTLDANIETKVESSLTYFRVTPQRDTSFFPPNANCGLREWTSVDSISRRRYPQYSVTDYLTDSWSDLSEGDKTAIVATGLAALAVATIANSETSRTSSSTTAPAYSSIQPSGSCSIRSQQDGSSRTGNKLRPIADGYCTNSVAFACTWMDELGRWTCTSGNGRSASPNQYEAIMLSCGCK